MSRRLCHIRYMSTYMAQNVDSLAQVVRLDTNHMCEFGTDCTRNEVSLINTTNRNGHYVCSNTIKLMVVLDDRTLVFLRNYVYYFIHPSWFW